MQRSELFLSSTTLFRTFFKLFFLTYQLLFFLSPLSSKAGCKSLNSFSNLQLFLKVFFQLFFNLKSTRSNTQKTKKNNDFKPYFPHSFNWPSACISQKRMQNKRLFTNYPNLKTNLLDKILKKITTCWLSTSWAINYCNADSNLCVFDSPINETNSDFEADFILDSVL